jgi:Lipocalin-like domain
MRSLHGAAVIVVVAFLFACNKSSTGDPVHDKLVGKWKGVKNIVDSNGNHIIDVHDAVDILNNPYVIEYYSNGTGAYLLNGASAGSFTWQLAGNSTYLTVVSTSGTATQHIDSLTATTLVLKDTTGISYDWQMFSKQ